MALIACKECGKEISEKAEACPHCGAKPKAKTSVITWIVGIAGGLWITSMLAPFVLHPEGWREAAEAASSGNGTAATKRCTADAIQIKSMKARFVDHCKRSACYGMEGVAVLTNTCDEPTGVQVKITGLDASGAPVSSRDLWPASVSNIPPGDYTFSLDQYLDYNPQIKTFTLQPIDVRQWRQR